jgi:hypothetical protein
MTCTGDHEWTVQFPDLPGTTGVPEFRPSEMSLRLNRSDFDFCRLTFDVKVGENLKGFTGFTPTGTHRAHVLLDGEIITTMMASPNGFEYGDRNTYVSLYDLQKDLDSGVIDDHFEGENIQNTYKAVFKNRDTTLIDEIKFTFNSEPVEGKNPRELIYQNRVSAQQAEEAQKFMKSSVSIDFDNVSPLRAIYKLNEDLGLHSWIDKDGVLWIGIPEINPTVHIAAPNDDRVWDYTSVNVRHPREKIKGVAVHGAWVDQPGINLEADAKQIAAWFNIFSDGKKTGDYRLVGVAERTDIDDGRVYEAKNANVKRDGIAEAAKIALIEEMKRQNQGQIQINPDTSGAYTSFASLTPGDTIQVIPNDKYFERPHRANTGQTGDKPAYANPDWCGSVPRNEVYTIGGIQHQVHLSGSWSTTLDVLLWPYESIGSVKSSTLYFNPRATEDDSEEAYVTRGEAHTWFLENN